MTRLLLFHSSSDLEQAVEKTLLRIGVQTSTTMNADDVLASLVAEPPAVLVIEHELAGERLPSLIDAVRHARGPRPVVIVTGDVEDLDPNVVSLIVPHGYDTSALVGVILACTTEAMMPPPGEATAPQIGC